jgi:pullulanase/glycogen debranching enzyme
VLCFVQDPLNAVQDSPAIVEEIAADAVLASCKLIAASANDALLPRNGERGFPHYGVLLEWNNRFGNDILRLLRDNTGTSALSCVDMMTVCELGCSPIAGDMLFVGFSLLNFSS